VLRSISGVLLATSSHIAAQHVKKTGQHISQAGHHMYQIFEQLMIDFDFQLALRTRSKRKLSVFSIGRGQYLNSRYSKIPSLLKHWFVV